MVGLAYDRATVEVGDLALLADELVTNAFRHAGGATAVLVCGASPGGEAVGLEKA